MLFVIAVFAFQISLCRLIVKMQVILMNAEAAEQILEDHILNLS